ncbi:MAG: diacylglycerol kinase [Bacteroidota bacterium]
MAGKNKIQKRVRSFGYAFKGLAHVFRTQPNMQIHVVLFLIAIFMGFFFNISKAEWLAIISVSGLVFALEAVNTAIEKYLDKNYPEKDKTTGQIKDIAAAAVLIGAITAFIAGVIIFLPKILTWL